MSAQTSRVAGRILQLLAEAEERGKEPTYAELLARVREEDAALVARCGIRLVRIDGRPVELGPTDGPKKARRA
jgi:hypothetical protein